MKKQNGFTLVELAIVLMIIGLLIGGVLRGQELLNQSRLQNVIKQVNSYQAAIATFRDTYQNYPGDFAQATTKIPGCEVAANHCKSGDGDGSVGAPGLVWVLGDQSIPSEGAQFWKQLALTHLISGIDPSTNIVEFGKSHPETAAGGGFSVVTTVRDAADPTGSLINGSLVLRLHNDLTTVVIENNPVMSPHQASYIDRKMDDGIPNTGSVQSTASGAIEGVGGNSQADCEVAYKESNTQAICTMSFLLNR